MNISGTWQSHLPTKKKIEIKNMKNAYNEITHVQIFTTVWKTEWTLFVIPRMAELVSVEIM